MKHSCPIFCHDLKNVLTIQVFLSVVLAQKSTSLSTTLFSEKFRPRPQAFFFGLKLHVRCRAKQDFQTRWKTINHQGFAGKQRFDLRFISMIRRFPKKKKSVGSLESIKTAKILKKLLCGSSSSKGQKSLGGAFGKVSHRDGNKLSKRRRRKRTERVYWGLAYAFFAHSHVRWQHFHTHRVRENHANNAPMLVWLMGKQPALLMSFRAGGCRCSCWWWWWRDVQKTWPARKE